MELPLLVAWPSKANNSGKVFVDARHKAHAVLSSMHIVGIMCNIMPGQEIKISKSKFALPHSTGCTRLWQRCVHYKRRNNTLSLPPTLSMGHRNLETWSCGESSEPSTAWQEGGEREEVVGSVLEPRESTLGCCGFCPMACLIMRWLIASDTVRSRERAASCEGWAILIRLCFSIAFLGILSL